MQRIADTHARLPNSHLTSESIRPISMVDHPSRGRTGEGLGADAEERAETGSGGVRDVGSNLPYRKGFVDRSSISKQVGAMRRSLFESRFGGCKNAGT